METYGEYMDLDLAIQTFTAIIVGFGLICILDYFSDSDSDDHLKKDKGEQIYAILSKWHFTKRFCDVLIRYTDSTVLSGNAMYMAVGLIIAFIIPSVYLLITVQSYALFLFIPWFLIQFTTRTLNYMTLTKETQMQMIMPQTYSETMKELRRSGSVRDAVLNTSKFVKDPVSRELKDIANRMRVYDNKKVLEEAYHTYHNPWVKNYFGVLMQLVDSASIEASLETLESLRQKCQEKNDDLQQELTKSKEITNNGFMVAGFAVVVGIVGTFVPAGRDAFFASASSLMGYLFCWLCVFVSVFYLVKANSIEGDDNKW